MMEYNDVDLGKIAEETYEWCDKEFKKEEKDFFELADDYLYNSYPFLNFTQKNEILDTIEDMLIKEVMKDD